MSGIFESMGIDSGIVIIVLLILTIILLINVVSSNMRLSRLERKYKMFMRGGDAPVSYTHLIPAHSNPHPTRLV